MTRSKRWFNSLARRTRGSNRKKNARRLGQAVEALESRTLLTASVSLTSADPILIDNVTASADSYANESSGSSFGSPQLAVDGSGWNSGTDTHTNDTWTTGWVSNDYGQDISINGWFKVDLGTEQSLEQLRLFNGNEVFDSLFQDRWVKQADIFVSAAAAPGSIPTANASSADWILVEADHVFTQGPGNAAHNSPDEISLVGHDARWVGLNIDSIGGVDSFGAYYAHIAELQVLQDGIDYATTYTVGDNAVNLTTGNAVVDGGVGVATLSISVTDIADGSDEHLKFTDQAVTPVNFDIDLSQSLPAPVTATFGATSVSIDYDGTTFTIQDVNGPANPLVPGDLDALIRSLTYENTSSSPSTANERTFGFVVTDTNGADSPVAVSTMSVVALNRAAAIDLDSAVTDAPLSPHTVSSNGPLFGTAPTLIDGDTVNRVAFFLGQGVDFNFTFASPKTIDEIVIFNGYEQAGEELTGFDLDFFDVGGSPIGSTQSLTVPGQVAMETASFPAVSNVKSVRLTPTTGSATIELRDVQFAEPVVPDYSTTYTEDAAAVAITDSDADVHDFGENDLVSLTIALTNITDGVSERIKFLDESVSQVDFDVDLSQSLVVPLAPLYGATTFSISYDGSAFTIENDLGSNVPMAQADLDALLRALTYENTADDPTETNKTFVFMATDAGGLTSVPAISTVSVVAQNDAPVIVSDDGGPTTTNTASTPVGPDNFREPTDYLGVTTGPNQLVGGPVNGVSLDYPLGVVAGQDLNNPSGDWSNIPYTWTVSNAEGFRDVSFSGEFAAHAAGTYDSADTFSFELRIDGDLVDSVTGNAIGLNPGGVIPIELAAPGNGATEATVTFRAASFASSNQAFMASGNLSGVTANQGTVTMDENQTSVTTVVGTDVDGPSSELIFSIVGGADQALFDLDPNSGVLSFDNAPDFENPLDVGNDNAYEVEVQATDAHGLFDIQTLTVLVADVSLPVSINNTTNGSENNGAAVVDGVLTVTQSAVSEIDTVVTYVVDGSSSAAPGDYTAPSGTATILAGMTSVDITIPVVEDGQVEGSETVVLTITGVSSGDGVLDANPLNLSAANSILDDDQVTLSVDDPDAQAEGDDGTTTTHFEVSIDQPDPNNDVTVEYTISGGNEDAATGTLTFLAGTTELSQMIAVTTSGDTDVEADEAISVALSSPGGNAVIDGTGIGSSSFSNDDAALISIDDPDAQAEGDSGSTTTSFLVTIDQSDPNNDITVEYTISGGNEDTNTGTLTFLAGTTQLSQMVDVTTTGDTNVEADHPISVSLSSPSPNVTMDGTGVGSSSFTNDDVAVVSIVDAASQLEGDEDVTTTNFVVSIDQSDPNNDISVEYTISGGNEDTDSGTLTFVAGTTELSQSISVTTTGDTMVEADEAISVTLSSPSGNAIINGTGVGVSNFTNDDTATIAIGDPDDQAEGDDATSTINFTVSIDQADPNNDVTVEYLISGGNEDSNTGTVTFTAGTTELSQFIPVTTNGDTAIEVDEAISVTLSNPSVNATIDGTGVGTGSFTNDDSALITIDDPDASDEGNDGTSTIDFAISIDQSDPNNDISVDFTIAGGNEDTNTGTLTFLAGTTELSQALSVTTTGDTDVEADEAVSVTLSNAGGNAMIDGAGVGTSTFTNDDVVVVDINEPAPQAEGDEETSTKSFVVSIDQADPNNEVTVEYLISGGNEDGQTGVLTFATGTTELSQTVDVTTNGDTNVEADEVVSITLSDPSANASIGSGVGSSTFTNDDTAVITIDDATPQVEGDDGPTAIDFVVSIDQSDPNNDITVEYSIGGGNEDATTGTLTFLAGTTELTQTIAVSTTGDTAIEADEAINVTLSAPSINAIIGGTGVGLSSFANDDVAVIAIDDPEPLPEGDDETTDTDFIVSIDQSDPNNDITVEYTITGGNEDSNTGTLTFAAGTTELSQAVNVSITGDTVIEADEAISVALTNPSENAAVDGLGVGYSSFTNDDAASINIDNPTSQAEGDEGSTTTSFTISIDQSDPNNDITVEYLIAGGNENADTGSLIFPAGTQILSQSMDVTTTGDTDIEADEPISIALSNPSQNAFVGTGVGSSNFSNDDAAIVTINDPTEQAEGDGGIATTNFIVSIDQSDPNNDITISYAISGGNEDANAGTLNFLAGTNVVSQIIAVTTSGDTLIEDDEPLSVTLSNPIGNAVIAESGVGFSAFTNDDFASITIDSPASQAEGNDGTTLADFIVNIDQADPNNDITVDYEISGGNEDATMGTVTFPAATSLLSQTVSVTTTGDGDVEADESIGVTLSNPIGNAMIDGAGVGSSSFTNDDVAEISIIGPDPQAEGNEGTTSADFIVSIDQSDPNNDITVDYSIAGGIEDSTVGTLTFAAGTTDLSQAISVTTAGDTDIEADESVSVTLTNTSSNATIHVAGFSSSSFTNDDMAMIAISNPESQEEGDEGTTSMDFVVSIDQSDPNNDVTVDYMITGGNEDDATGTLIFTAGTTELSQPITVTTPGDTVVEADEFIAVTLSSPSDNAMVESTGVGTSSFADDDIASLSVADIEVNEDAGTASVTVTVDNAVQGGFDVDVIVSDETATGDGVDYQVTAGLLTFQGTAGESQTVTVAITDDVIAEGVETANVALEDDHPFVAATDTATLTINDNDTATIGISNTINGAEHNGGAVTNGVLTVMQSSILSTDSVVAYSVSSSSTATLNADYVALSGTVTIPAGATSATINVAVIEESLVENSHETVVVVLDEVTSGSATLDPDTANLTATNVIQNDDFPILPPSVNQSENVVTAVATAGDDFVELILGDETHLLTINEFEFSFDAASVDTFQIGGGHGVNTVHVIGRNVNDQVSLSGTSGAMSSTVYQVNTYSFATSNYDGGGGFDGVALYGSDAADLFHSLPERSTLTTPGSQLQALNFERVDAFGRGGADYATVFGSTGNDRYAAMLNYEVIVGGSLTRVTKGFERVDVFGRTGFDVATILDSPNDDVLTVRPPLTAGANPYAFMESQGRMRYAKGFEELVVTAMHGGSDRVDFLDNPLTSDTFVTGIGFAEMSAGTQQVRVVGFGKIEATSTGGPDEARFEGLRSVDTFFGLDDLASAMAEDRDQTVMGFDTVFAEAEDGESPIDNVSESIDYLLERIGWGI